MKSKSIYFLFLFIIALLFSNCEKIRSVQYERAMHRALSLINDNQYNVFIDELLVKDKDSLGCEAYFSAVYEASTEKLLPVIIKKLDSDINVEKKETLISLIQSVLIRDVLRYINADFPFNADKWIKYRDSWFKEKNSYRKLSDSKLYENAIDKVLEITENNELSDYSSVISILYFSNCDKGIELYKKMITKCDGGSSYAKVLDMLERSNNPQRVNIIKDFAANEDVRLSKRAKELLDKIKLEN